MDKKAQKIEDKQVVNIQETIKKQVEAQQRGESVPGGSIKLPPSKARILNMSYPILLENYALIKIKASSLSSSQRSMVLTRVAFLLTKGKLTVDEINSSMDFINNLKVETS
tara:strand:- start:3663 stop:3995 length:333 start_codon:yes stop_codon:yes gene_type:complete